MWLLLAGAHWKKHSTPSTPVAIASSADGVKLVALQSGVGRIITSTNSGVSWVVRGPTGLWISVASSKNGVKLVAMSDRAVYTSADSGLHWVLRFERNARCDHFRLLHETVCMNRTLSMCTFEARGLRPAFSDLRSRSWCHVTALQKQLTSIVQSLEPKATIHN